MPATFSIGTGTLTSVFKRFDLLDTVTAHELPRRLDRFDGAGKTRSNGSIESADVDAFVQHVSNGGSGLTAAEQWVAPLVALLRDVMTDALVGAAHVTVTAPEPTLGALPDRIMVASVQGSTSFQSVRTLANGVAFIDDTGGQPIAHAALAKRIAGTNPELTLAAIRAAMPYLSEDERIAARNMANQHFVDPFVRQVNGEPAFFIEQPAFTAPDFTATLVRWATATLDDDLQLVTSVERKIRLESSPGNLLVLNGPPQNPRSSSRLTPDVFGPQGMIFVSLPSASTVFAMPQHVSLAVLTPAAPGQLPSVANAVVIDIP